jgi:hypothetical protein
MNYLLKKLKYERKYELINNFKGGAMIDTMKDLFNRHFRQNWILTGSAAIEKYLDHFKITDFKFTVNDVDIFYINNDSPNITETRFEDYIARQKTPEKSKTFSNGVSSFDVTILSSSHSYYEIEGIKLDVPENMLEQYLENIERGHPEDQIKINALHRIITRLNPDDKKKIELPRKRARRSYYDEGAEGAEGDASAAALPPGRLRFTHIGVDEEEKVVAPKPLGASGALNFEDLAGSPPKSGATGSSRSSKPGVLNFNDL